MFYHDDICNLCFRKGSVFTDEHYIYPLEFPSRKSLETQKVRESLKRFTRNEAATWTSTFKILKCTAELKFQKQAQLCLRVDSVPVIMVRDCPLTPLSILTEVIKKSSLGILYSIFILDKSNDQSNSSGNWGNNNDWGKK